MRRGNSLLSSGDEEKLEVTEKGDLNSSATKRELSLLEGLKNALIICEHAAGRSGKKDLDSRSSARSE